MVVVVAPSSSVSLKTLLNWLFVGKRVVCAPFTFLNRQSTVFINLVCLWHAGLTETVDLFEVKARKGFSHGGRLNSGRSFPPRPLLVPFEYRNHSDHNSIIGGDYSPLRSVSLFLGDGCGDWRSFNIRASSAWSAQLWVDGLTAAHYVYRCMVEQCYASDSHTELDTSHWFSRTLYLPLPHHQSNTLSTSHHQKPVTRQSLRSWSRSTSCSNSDSDREVSTIHRCARSSGSGYYSERSLTPSSPRKISGSLASRSHYSSVCLSMEPRHGESPPGSTPGLPYVYSSLSTICPCHAYEIMPSRSVDVRFSEVEKKPLSKTCCRQCRNACKIAMDMDNL